MMDVIKNERNQLSGVELKIYDAVWSTQGVRAMKLKDRDLPYFNGDHVKNLCILHTEGYGDAFLFGRYIKSMLLKAENVSIIVASSLYELFKDNMPIGVEVFDKFGGMSALNKADAWVTTESLVYLSEQKYGDAKWITNTQRVNLFDKPRIGIVWAGSQTNNYNNIRSVPIASISRLFEIPGIEWHSLQIGDFAHECPDNVFDYSDDISNWSDTVMLAKNLDLVIAVDTGTANLIGAMGLPLWVLVEQRPDFRWGSYGEETPWFPSARVFRKGKDNKWKPVINKVASALIEFKSNWRPQHV